MSAIEIWCREIKRDEFFITGYHAYDLTDPSLWDGWTSEQILTTRGKMTDCQIHIRVEGPDDKAFFDYDIEDLLNRFGKEETRKILEEINLPTAPWDDLL